MLFLQMFTGISHQTRHTHTHNCRKRKETSTTPSISRIKHVSWREWAERFLSPCGRRNLAGFICFVLRADILATICTETSTSPAFCMKPMKPVLGHSLSSSKSKRNAHIHTHKYDSEKRIPKNCFGNSPGLTDPLICIQQHTSTRDSCKTLPSGQMVRENLVSQLS